MSQEPKHETVTERRRQVAALYGAHTPEEQQRFWQERDERLRVQQSLPPRERRIQALEFAKQQQAHRPPPDNTKSGYAFRAFRRSLDP